MPRPQARRVGRRGWGGSWLGRVLPRPRSHEGVSAERETAILFQRWVRGCEDPRQSPQRQHVSGDCPCWCRCQSPPWCRGATLPRAHNVDTARQGTECRRVSVPRVGTTYLLSRALMLNEIRKEEPAGGRRWSLLRRRAREGTGCSWRAHGGHRLTTAPGGRASLRGS